MRDTAATRDFHDRRSYHRTRSHRITPEQKTRPPSPEHVPEMRETQLARPVLLSLRHQEPRWRPHSSLTFPLRCVALDASCAVSLLSVQQDACDKEQASNPSFCHFRRRFCACVTRDTTRHHTFASWDSERSTRVQCTALQVSTCPPPPLLSLHFLSNGAFGLYIAQNVTFVESLHKPPGAASPVATH